MRSRRPRGVLRIKWRNDPMTLYAIVLWLYAVMASIVLGAGVYESLVVHPAWSRKPPESFVAFVGARMNIAGFWALMTPLWALSGVAAWVVALSTGRPPASLTVSAACAVLAVVWTLVYFRPRIVRFLDGGSGNTPAERLQSDARRWVLLNWIRIAMCAVSWWGVLRAIAAHG
jgi:hypothetical protein